MNKNYKIENLSIDEAFSKFSSSRQGLSGNEAQKRFKETGPNEIIERKVSPLLKFLGYFWGPIPWMIEIAAILSAVIHHWEDFWVIFAMLLINSIVGFWQEYKADNAIELLKKNLAPMARVFRDGDWEQIPARELVIGDIVRMRPGDIVPADVKLIEGDYLSVDQSTLTGESLPVEKKKSDICYSGSVINEGEMEALVISTGMNTYFGKTAELVEKAKTRSHFQKAVIKIGDYLIMLALFLVTVIFIEGIFRHENVLEILKFSLVLVVASIPVALPAVLTVTMAVGATLLSKKKAIVSKLVAIEEMAGVDVLCSDKTGTITKNELNVKEIKVFNGYKVNDVLFFGVLASRKENRDPIDDTIFKKAESTKGALDEVKKCNVINFKPFDSKLKRTEADVEGPDGNKFKTAKGAPQVILSMVNDSEFLRCMIPHGKIQHRRWIPLKIWGLL